MKRIYKFGIDGKVYELGDTLTSFLYYSINIFLLQNKFDLVKKRQISIRDEQILVLKTEFERILHELLLAGYEKPNERHIQKHHSSYERLFFSGVKYTVNYRTSSFGRVAYALMGFIEAFESSISEGKEIVLMIGED